MRLRKLLGIKWLDKIPDSDTVVLERAGLPSIFILLIKAQLRWAGHVARMSDNCHPEKLLFGELKHGKRQRGAPKKWFKDSLKVSSKAFEISPDTWESEAKNRSGWRGALYAGGERHVERHLNTAVVKRNA